MRWGFAGPYMGEYNIWQAKDQTKATLDFVAGQGFSAFHLNFKEARDNGERGKQIAEWMQEKNMRAVVNGGVAWASPDRDLVKRQVESLFKDLDQWGKALNITLIHAGVGGHRFQRAPLPSCEQVIEHMVANCAEPAIELLRRGTPLCFENHGDYYVSDLVKVCQRAPGVKIFLDTGNCYLIGEKTLPAAIEAAPFIVGGHFKDHCVHPDPSILHFVIEGAALGEGDVGLADIFRVIRRDTPNFDKVEFIWELVPAKGDNALDAMARSWAFCRKMEAELEGCK